MVFTMTNILNVDDLLQTGGLVALALIIFAETGLLMGFFLPGDTLLIAAGIFAAEGKIPLILALPVAAIAAIAGYQLGYKIGAKAGPRFFTRNDGLLFKREYIIKTEGLVAKHGVGAILIARFIAVVRTIVPLVAGMGKMDKKRFWINNVVGSILWTFSVILASYWLGSKIPNLDKFLIPLLLLAMILTTGSILVGLLRSRKKRAELRAALKQEFRYLFKRPKA